jgi:hypothetical protein
MAVDTRVFRSELHPEVRFEVSHDLDADRWSVAWHPDDDPAAGSTVDDSEGLFPRGPHTHERLYEWAVEHWETRASTAANEFDSALDTNATSPDFFDAL